VEADLPPDPDPDPERAVVLDKLLAAQGAPEGVQGPGKLTHWLRRQGHAVAFCTVDRLMWDLGMSGVRHGRGHCGVWLTSTEMRGPVGPSTMR